MSELLEINGLRIELVRKPIKNMSLRVFPPDGRIKVSAPLSLPMSYIVNQLNIKSPWMHKQRTRFQTQDQPEESTVSNQSIHYFQGTGYPLQIYYGAHTPPVFLKDSILHLYTKPCDHPLKQKRLLNQWYCEQMSALIPDLLAHWEKIIGVNVLEWRIRDMKSRWGSCNPQTQRICLNLKLIKKPLACLEYVLVHELIHLLERGHNQRFYSFMSQFLPNWRETQKILESSPS